MIHIRELFRLQDIQHLRLIAGRDGLERTVTAAVLFEYDPSRVQLPDFYRGDLVVTTLAYARGDAQLVAHSLQALMNQGIASLMVKTAYFSELPQSVIALANRLGTPVFLFDDTYIEEVILQVTDLIRGKRHFSGFEQDVDALMRGASTRSGTGAIGCTPSTPRSAWSRWTTGSTRCWRRTRTRRAAAHSSSGGG